MKREHHGMCGTPEYEVWKAMKQRCHNPQSQRYGYYGARGITVCDEWRESFSKFISDMGRRPGPSFSIERVNNDLGYCLANCIWQESALQKANKRTNRKLTFNNLTLHICEWSRRTGIHYRVIGRRLDRGWTTEEALATPLSNTRRKK